MLNPAGDFLVMASMIANPLGNERIRKGLQVYETFGSALLGVLSELF